MAQRDTGPFDLSASPIHLGADHAPAEPLPGFQHTDAGFEAYAVAHCRAGPGRIVMMERSTEDWPAWERHPEGDEVVIIVEGRADFHQEIDGEVRTLAVGPGDAVINPAGVWHTADVHAPVTAIYITPAPGTEHKPR